MKKHIKKSLAITGGAILIVLFGNIFNIPTKTVDYIERIKINRENEKTIESIQKNDIIKDQIETFKINHLPEKAYLEVPFVCQAPLQTEKNWLLHEESCEETALLQAYLYETGHTMTKEEANKEILNMIKWQNENYGKQKDLYAEDLKKFIIGYYKISENKIEIIKKASIEDIKLNIATGHPVIVPITGDILKNPYYPYPGYHMLTVIGYTKDRIITNDNGTKRGEDFSYNIDIFKKAMDDTGGDIVILKLKN